MFAVGGNQLPFLLPLGWICECKLLILNRLHRKSIVGGEVHSSCVWRRKMFGRFSRTIHLYRDEPCRESKANPKPQIEEDTECQKSFLGCPRMSCCFGVVGETILCLEFQSRITSYRCRSHDPGASKIRRGLASTSSIGGHGVAVGTEINQKQSVSAQASITKEARQCRPLVLEITAYHEIDCPAKL
jgi:hypothetical protein